MHATSGEPGVHRSRGGGSAAAIANPNIAFVKYWGNRDAQLRIPASGSISMNLAGLHSLTRVTFDPALEEDELFLNSRAVPGPERLRVSAVLERVRQLASMSCFARVESSNDFPTGAGIASSASAFAALSLAASAAAGLALNERELSRLARLGSGSACRSVPGGFVEWLAGEDDESSFAFSLAPAEHWRLDDCVALICQEHKATGSSEGHALAESSPLQPARLAGAAQRLERCRKAILERDFEALAEVVEQDCLLLHAVTMTSQPALLYWQPATLAVIHAVLEMREKGTPACFTIDAGPNVHVLSPGQASAAVAARLREIPGVERVIVAAPGGPARLLEA